MKDTKPDILGPFAADFSLELLSSLIEKGIYTKDEAAAVIMRVSEKNTALDKETSTSMNKEIADFARDMATAVLSPKS